MYLPIDVYDDTTDSYLTDVYYHNDLVYTPVTYQGTRMIQIDDFELIGH